MALMGHINTAVAIIHSDVEAAATVHWISPGGLIHNILSPPRVFLCSQMVAYGLQSSLETKSPQPHL